MTCLCRTSKQHAWVLGGVQILKMNSEASKKCLRFDLALNTWQKMPSMKIGRFLCSSCLVADFLYVFCGISKNRALNSIEKLKIFPSSSDQKK